MWVAIACADDTVWERLARIIDPGLVADERFRTLAGRKRHEEELERAVSVWTAELDRWDITRELQAAGIAAMPTYACDDVIDDPHLNERGFIERLEHPEVGRRAHTGIPWRLTRRPNGVRAPAPCLGADTPRVLTDVLGYAAERVAALAEQGALG